MWRGFTSQTREVLDPYTAQFKGNNTSQIQEDLGPSIIIYLEFFTDTKLPGLDLQQAPKPTSIET